MYSSSAKKAWYSLELMRGVGKRKWPQSIPIAFIKAIPTAIAVES